MERAQNAYSAICRFCDSVIEWRSPATGPYLLAVNSIFWLSVFYCEHLLQMRMLVSIAVGVLSWDILLSSSNDSNIATHIVMWPVRSLWRTASVVLSLYSWNLIRLEQIEPACWAAYGTLGCLLVNPVWQANDVNEKLLDSAKYVGTGVSNTVTAVFSAVVYVVTFQWVPPLWNLFKGGLGNACKTIASSTKNFFTNLKEGWITYVVEPIRRSFYAVGRWLRYWFCAHWWPDLKAWMAVHIGQPCRRAFNYVCFCLVYVFCGYWIPPLARFLKRHLNTFCAFLYRTAVEPAKLWLLAKFDEFRLWLRAQLHRLAVAIRDSVLWPICVLIVDTGKEISLFVYRIAIKPVLDYFYQRYKIIETAVLIYILGPVCKIFINNIPEKNPFCDESDIELEGMLPDEMSEVDDIIATQNDFEESDFLPKTPLDESKWSISTRHLEEERDFAAGLNFPDVDASESSDDEFDLKKSKNLRQRRKKEIKKPLVGGYDEDFEELR